MYELRMMDSQNVEQQVAREVLGGFNDFPPGWTEISMEDFVEYSLGAFLPTYIDYRQMCFDINRGPVVYATLFVHRDLTGYAPVPSRRDHTLSYFSFDGLSKLKELFESLPIVSDSGWNLDEYTSRPMRGIRDFKRTIILNRYLNEKEDLIVRKYLLRDNCPGWTGISGGITTDGKGSECVYVFGTTYDSSD